MSTLKVFFVAGTFIAGLLGGIGLGVMISNNKALRVRYPRIVSVKLPTYLNHKLTKSLTPKTNTSTWD